MPIPEEAIRSELTRKLNRDDEASIRSRKRRLTELFQELSAPDASTLLARLGDPQDDLGRLFHGRLASATRHRLTTLLMDLVAPSGSPAVNGSDSPNGKAPVLASPPVHTVPNALTFTRLAVERWESKGHTEYQGIGVDVLRCMVDTAGRADFDDTVILAEAVNSRLSAFEGGELSVGDLTSSFLAQWKNLRLDDDDSVALGRLARLADQIGIVIDYVTRHLAQSGIAASPNVVRLNEWLRERRVDPRSLIHCFNL